MNNTDTKPNTCSTPFCPATPTLLPLLTCILKYRIHRTYFKHNTFCLSDTFIFKQLTGVHFIFNMLHNKKHHTKVSSELNKLLQLYYTILYLIRYNT